MFASPHSPARTRPVQPFEMRSLRRFDARCARFLQADPIGYGDGMNMYAYAGGDPVNRTDPSGTVWWPSRMELKRDDAGTSWGLSSGGSGGGGLYGPVGPEGGVREDVANNIYWERTDGRGGQWGGNVIARDGGFYLSGSTQGSGASWNANLGRGGPLSDEGLSPGEFDDIVVSGWRRNRIAGRLINYNLVEPREDIWVAYGPTQFDHRQSRGRLSGEVGRSSLRSFAPGYIIIIHSHPRWSEELPGPGDFGHSVPVYGLTPNGVWVIRVGSTGAEWLARRNGGGR